MGGGGGRSKNLKMCLRNIWTVPKSVAFVEASGCDPHQTSPNKSRPVQLASIKLHQSTELGPDVYLMQGKKMTDV